MPDGATLNIRYILGYAIGLSNRYLPLSFILSLFPIGKNFSCLFLDYYYYYSDI
uniref:Uncharacterized protein n=1 Tax=Anguilla anguilla TaxID=7936 RepID=A0A0E9PNV6_ANGAN